ncbi:MAG: Flp family type IVb pilin [Bosea sp.]|nr:Flp family type IVb pilin [Bosea sp. (in: a-proteobacteria)]
MKPPILRLFRNDSGATALEYGLVAAIMSGAILAAMPVLREAVLSLYTIVSTAFASAGS